MSDRRRARHGPTDDSGDHRWIPHPPLVMARIRCSVHGLASTGRQRFLGYGVWRKGNCTPQKRANARMHSHIHVILRWASIGGTLAAGNAPPSLVFLESWKVEQDFQSRYKNSSRPLLVRTKLALSITPASGSERFPHYQSPPWQPVNTKTPSAPTNKASRL